MIHENHTELTEGEFADGGKVVLIVKAYPNYKTRIPQYSWNFPNPLPSSTLLGIMDLIKDDIITAWKINIAKHERNEG